MIQELNPEQQKAARQVEGPVLIIAGAGSGKTRTLTHRIAYLVQECGVDPWHILAVTFTNKAAGEMRERVEKLLGGKSGRRSFIPDLEEAPLISTFHSFGVRLLRKEGEKIGISPKFTIYDASDQKALIKKSAIEAGVDIERWKPANLQWLISAAKNDGLDPKQFAEKASGDASTSPGAGMAAKTYFVYQKKLKEADALDFDDLLLESVRLLENHKDVLEKYQERFQYLLVDEYQDTNKVQYKMIRLLSDKYRNLCVVGDDDQSIYAWRGADIRNILEFEKDFPDAAVVRLEQNYRSTSHILEGAHAVISKNKNRKEKKLWTELGEGHQISVIEAYSGRDEAAQIVQEIEGAIREDNRSLADFAVLYRTNAQSRVLEEAFLNAGIPYQIVGGTRFYERKEIKDVLAYLKVLSNPLDSMSLQRIINVPSRKIGATTIDKLNSYSVFNNLPLYDVLAHLEDVDLGPGTANRVAGFFALVRELRQEMTQAQKLSTFLKKLIEKTNYDKYLQDGTDDGEQRYENVLELLSVAKRYDEMQLETALSAFLEEVALITDLDNIAEQGAAVTLMTMHLAKGLEYPVIFLAGMEEDLFPHLMSMDSPTGIEEERRLCYVGMTRAMQKLFICHAEERLIFGQVKVQRPSRFLGEIPMEHLDKPATVESGPAGFDDDSSVRYVSDDDFSLPELEIGDRVSHTVFGAGTVLDVVGRVVTVDFGPGRGVKKILAEKLQATS